MLIGMGTRQLKFMNYDCSEYPRLRLRKWSRSMKLRDTLFIEAGAPIAGQHGAR